MSTIAKTNFEPVSNLMYIETRDFQLADPTLANPTNAVALVDGEWMTFDSNGKVVRASTIGTGDNLATVQSWPMWANRGSTDIQAMGQRKVPLLWLHSWEFDTRVFDASKALGSGAAITAVGQPVKVATITVSGRNFTGLVGHGGAGSDASPIVGYVSKLPANNGGKLRIRGGMLY